VFRGKFEHAIDGKGRTSLPSRFRELLSASGDCRVVLTTGFEQCVLCYPMDEWVAFEERLASKPQFDPSVIAIRQLYIGNAVDCEVDKLGRLLIPGTLREAAGLTRDAIWLGALKHIQLWDKGRYVAARDALLADPIKSAAVQQRLTELGL
jgi:MraZ protein